MTTLSRIVRVAERELVEDLGVEARRPGDVREPAAERAGHRRGGRGLDHEVVHPGLAAALALAADGAGGERDDRGALAAVGGLERAQAPGRARSRRRSGAAGRRTRGRSGCAVKRLERLLGVAGGVGDEAERLELAGEDLAVDRVVLDEQQHAALALGLLAARGAGGAPGRARRRAATADTGSGSSTRTVVPSPQRALDADRPAHRLDELLADHEPEPGAPGAPLAGLGERAEEPRAILGGDADALVGDREASAPRVDAERHSPASVNLIALPTRLPSTWRSRIASAS